MWICLNWILSKVVPLGCTLHWSCVEVDFDFPWSMYRGALDRYSVRVLYLYCMRVGIYKGMNPTWFPVLSDCLNGMRIGISKGCQFCFILSGSQSGIVKGKCFQLYSELFGCSYTQETLSHCCKRACLHSISWTGLNVCNFIEFFLWQIPASCQFYVFLVLAWKDYSPFHLIASRYSSNVLHTVPLPSFSSLIAFLVVSFGISITPRVLRHLTRPLPSFVLSLTVIVYVAISSSFVFRKYSLFIWIRNRYI